jgi:hypothetical protein
MATLFGLQARFPLRMTPQGVTPGAAGTIIDVEQLPAQTGPSPRVRIQIGDYKSAWLFPGQLEILAPSTSETGWYIERWEVGGVPTGKGEIARVKAPRETKHEDLQAMRTLGFERM